MNLYIKRIVFLATIPIVLFSLKTNSIATNIVLSLTAPDPSIVQKGGNLEFQVTITNNTDQAGTVHFATKVTLPNGNTYPASGYLVGPKKVTLNPHQSKSSQLSHTMPGSAQVGTYTYHGYVGKPGVGVMAADQFDFQVIDPSQGSNWDEMHWDQGHWD